MEHIHAPQVDPHTTPAGLISVQLVHFHPLQPLPHEMLSAAFASPQEVHNHPPHSAIQKFISFKLTAVQVEHVHPPLLSIHVVHLVDILNMMAVCRFIYLIIRLI